MKLKTKWLSLITAVVVSFSLLFPAAAFADQGEIHFQDYQPNHWVWKSGVAQDISNAGVITGVKNADGTVSFMPDEDITRAQVATMLFRLSDAEQPKKYPANTTDWVDAPDYKYYTAALNWAEEEGIFKGSNGKVRPNDPITREELVTVLCRMAAANDIMDGSVDEDRLIKYKDADDTSWWAEDSIAWGVEYQLIGGDPTMNLSPVDNCTRAEAAKMFLVFMNGGEKDEILFKAHTIDVGQGDAIFLEFGKMTMLIDAGPASAGDDVVNYIKALGHDSIDFVVASHTDADHIGGMLEVLKNFDVEKFYVPSTVSDTKTWNELSKYITDRTGVFTVTDTTQPIYYNSANDFEIDFINASTVMESSDELTLLSDTNDSSIIVYVSYGINEWLFTGDASADAIMEATADIGVVEVLKVGHHGSKTSTTEEVVNWLNPEYAIISVGDNSYGHPHKDVVRELNSAKIFATNVCGDIVSYGDKDEIWFNVKPGVEVGKNSQSDLITLEEEDDDIVYVTKSNMKYHYQGGCATKTYDDSFTVKVAKDKEYSLCQDCAKTFAPDEDEEKSTKDEVVEDVIEPIVPNGPTESEDAANDSESETNESIGYIIKGNLGKNYVYHTNIDCRYIEDKEVDSYSIEELTTNGHDICSVCEE